MGAADQGRGVRGLRLTRLAAGLLVVLFVVSTGWAAPAVVDWEYDYVNVRSEPGTEAERVGQLALGARAEVLEERGEWSRVRYPGGAGWVVTRSLRVLPEEPAPAPAPPVAAPPAAAAPAPAPAPREAPPPAPAAGESSPPSGYLAPYREDPPLPAVDLTSSVASLLAGLLLIFALLAAGVYLWRRFFLGRFPVPRRGGALRILETRPLGPRQGLVLVEAGGIVWLLAQGPDGVTPLAEIRDPAALARLNERFAFLESPFETELRRQLDLETGPETAAEPPGEPSAEERLAALRRRPERGDRT